MSLGLHLFGQLIQHMVLCLLRNSLLLFPPLTSGLTNSAEEVIIVDCFRLIYVEVGRYHFSKDATCLITFVIIF
jgi:hypothetical protein